MSVGGSVAEPGPRASDVVPAWPGEGPLSDQASQRFLPPQPDRFTLFLARFYTRLPRWAAPVAALGCLAAAAGYTEITDPTTSGAEAIPTCLVKLTTGLDCPGCGGTRAFWYVLHGDLGAAARHHLLFVFALPFLIYLYVAWAAKLSFGWRLPQLRLSPVVLGGFLVAWLAFTVARNLPWAPFTWLYV